MLDSRAGSCIGGAEETTDRHGLYLSAYVTGGEADGRNTTLLQKTRVVTQTQNPSWRQKLGPVRVHSKTGALRLSVPLYSHFSKLGKSRGSSQNGGFEPVTAADGEHDDTHTHCVYDPFTKATMGTHGRELRGTVTIQLRFIVQPSAVAPAEAAAPTSKSQTLNNKVKKLEHVPSGFHPTLFVPPTLPPITFDDDSSAGSATDPYMFPCVSGVQYKDVSVAGTPAPPSPLLPSILTTHNHTSSGGGAAVRRTEVPASPRLGTQTSAVKDLVNTEAMGASVRLARGLVSAVVMLWKEGLLDPDPASTTSLDLGPAADATASPKASALLSLAVVQLQDSFTSKFVKQSARAATSGTQTAVKVEGAGAGAGLGLGVGVGLGSAAGSTVAGVGQPLTKLTYVLKADAVRQPRQTWVLAEGPAAAASGRAAKLAKPTHRKTASKARTGDGGQGWDLAAIMLASTSFGSRPPIAPVAAKGLPSPFANSSAAGGKASSSQAPPSKEAGEHFCALYLMQIPGADASPKVDEILPGGVYWSLLSAAADLTRIRPQNLRLCLLTVVLECWTPRFRAIETARQVVAPLQVAADARLLTKMEATLYTQASGALLQKCIDILERHYELYESCVVHGTACLGSLMGVMQSVVTASSGPEVTARMMRIHLSAAVEKRMRALLHPSSSSIASSVEVLNSNHPDHLVSLASFRESGQPPPPPPPQQPSKADANHRNESAHVASWLAHMISSASQPSHAAPAHGVSSGNIAGGEAVPPRSSVTHRRNQSVTDALKAGGGGGGEGSIDISHLIVAVLVMLDDTEHDLMLQSMFAEYLNLPLFTTNVRYKLLSEQLRQTFDGRATVTFSEVVFQLQEQVTALATLLDTHGLAVSSSSSSSSNPEPDFRISPAPAPHPHPLQPNHSSKNIAVHSYTPGPPRLQSTSDSAPLPHLYAQSASPFSNPHAPPACTAPTSTDLKVELVDVCALFQPSVDLFIRNLGKRLLEWVDLTVSAEMSRAEGSRWAPVSLQERSFYSFSVVDLYFHLQTVLESVCKKVMRYGSAQQNANTARELHQVIAKAVQRYINHAEQLSLQKVSRDSQWEPLVLTNLVQLGTDAASPPPNASGKTSTPSTPPHDGARSQPAGSAIFPHSSKEQPPAAHARAGAAQRALTGPNGGVGGPGGHAAGGAGGLPAPRQQQRREPWRAGLGAAAAVVEVKPVTSTLQVCVLLNNMEQVVQQQRQLEKMLIRAARGGGDVEAMYSPSAGTASPSEQSPPKADANGGHSTRPSRATHHTPGGGSSHPAAASHRMRAAGASASFRLRGGAERHMRRSVGSSNGSSVAGGAGQYPDDHPSWSKLPHSAGKRHAHGTHTEMDDGLDAVSEDSTVSEMTEEGDSSDEEDDDEAGRMGGRHQSQEDVGDDSDALRWKSAYTRGEVASRTSTRKSLNVHSEVFGDESERLSRIVHLSIHGIMQHVGAQMQRKVIAALTAILNNLGHASASRGAGVAEQRGVAGGAAATAVVTPRAASKLRKAPTAAPHGPTAGAAAGSGVASAGHLPEDIEAELDLLSAALSGDLSLIRHYLSPSLLRKTLSCCWDYALGGIRRLALGQASYRPLRPPELRVMEAALKQLMSDFHADGSGLPVEMLQHRARPKQHLLQLAAQDTESLIRDYTSLTDDIILDPKMATSHPYRNAARKLLQPAAGIDDRNGTPRHPSTDVVPLDIIRLLLQRPGDRLASQYWEKHAASAQDSVMQMVFGLPPAETVVVFAGCRLSSCHQEGMVYLTSSYLAFTTLFKDKDVKAKSVAPGKPSTMGKLLMMMGAGSAGADDGYQPDTTLLISLRDVERLDSTFQASGQALTLTMLSRTAHVLYGFEAHVRDQLIQAIRLHVMGTDTCLDRCLRGLEGTQGALAMALPAGEAIVASFPCSKYAVLQPIPGVLYLCTSRLVFDSANSRQTILYSDLTSLKRTKDWRGGVWMLLQHQAVAATGASAGRDGAAGGAGRQGSVSSVGPPAPPQVLQVGNGTEELATDMLQSIASLSK
ncbi:MAG: hypothetical protein WDW36_007904 [Sanguina aurantia]